MYRRGTLGFVRLGNVLEEFNWGEASRDVETDRPADVTPRRAQEPLISRSHQVSPGSGSGSLLSRAGESSLRLRHICENRELDKYRKRRSEGVHIFRNVLLVQFSTMFNILEGILRTS